jgi:hypothetical protein
MLNKFNLKTRAYAAGIHLSISLFVVVTALATAYFIWYPPPFFRAAGGQELVLLIGAVDVIAGPLITFFIFNKAKRSLKFDLAVVALLQFGALCYGVWTMAAARPAYVVYAVDRFDVVIAADIDETDFARVTDPAFKRMSWLGPVWAGAKEPGTPGEQFSVAIEALQGGRDITARPYLFVALDKVASQIKDRALPLAKLKEYNPGESLAQIAVYMQAPEKYGFVPMKARHSMAVIVDKTQGTVVEVVPLSPW